MARMKSWMPVMPMSRSSAVEETAAAQEEMGAIMQMGAAVASMRYASFGREIWCRSVTERMTEPTVRQLK